MSVQIDWTKVPREIDGKMTRWVAMDKDGFWIAYTCDVVADAEEGRGIWIRESGEGPYYKVLSYVYEESWSNSTPWTETLTPTPWSQTIEPRRTMTLGELVTNKHVIKERDGIFLVWDADDADDYNDDLTGAHRRADDIMEVYEINPTPIWTRDDKADRAAELRRQIETLTKELEGL